MPFEESTKLEVFAVSGIGEIRPGDDLCAAIVAATRGDTSGSTLLKDGDVLVVTQKVVSKSEGRLERIDADDPFDKAMLVERESVRILRRRGELMISETHHGFICANAGIDLSNVEAGEACLLPIDPDRSARRLRADLRRALGVDVGVIVSDTFGRAWREGVTDVAIGCAGVAGVIDLRGTTDANGRMLVATQVCVADELAATANIVLGKDTRWPVAVLRGVPREWLRDGSVSEEIIRRANNDLFR